MENEPKTEILNPNSFEEQFELKRIEINDADVEYVDLVPENRVGDNTVLLAPGWAATVDSFKPGLKVLFNEGERVVSLNHPRKGGTIPDSFDEEIEKNPAEELRKAHTILGLLDQNVNEKVAVIAHSEGAVNVCIAAMLHPEKFNHIVLVNPAGLIGHDTLFRLMKGVMTHPKRPETMSVFPVTDAETEYLELTKNIGPDYQLANPLRAFKEVLAISQAQIEEMLKYLRSKGITIDIIAGVDDTFFPMEYLQKNVVSGDEGFVDGFLSVRGGHMQIQTHSELYVGAAESLIATRRRNAKKKVDEEDQRILDIKNTLHQVEQEQNTPEA